MEVYVRHYKGAGPGAGVEASLVIIELAGGPRLLRLGRRQGGGTPHRRASRRLLQLDRRWSGGTLLLIVDIVVDMHSRPAGWHSARHQHPPAYHRRPLGLATGGAAVPLVPIILAPTSGPRQVRR